MPLKYTFGTLFWANTQTSGTQFRIDCGFRPKAMRFFTNGTYAGSSSYGAARHSHRSIGFVAEAAGGTIKQVAFGSFDRDNVATQICLEGCYSGNCVLSLMNGVGINGSCFLASIDATGCYLSVGNQITGGADADNMNIYWEAWGDDVDEFQADIVDMPEPAAAGVQYYTLGFTPDVIMCCGSNFGLNGSGRMATSMYLGIGVPYVDGESNQCWAGASVDAAATSSTSGCVSNNVAIIMTGGGAAVNCYATVVPITNGVQNNWNVVTYAGRYHCALAIKSAGGLWKLGRLAIAGNVANSTATATCGWQPIGVSVFGRNSALTAFNSAPAQDQMSFGMATSTTNRMSFGVLDVDNLPTASNVGTSYNTDKILSYPGASALWKTYDISAITSTGFTIRTDLAANGVANEYIGYLAFGVNPSPPKTLGPDAVSSLATVPSPAQNTLLPVSPQCAYGSAFASVGPTPTYRSHSITTLASRNSGTFDKPAGTVAGDEIYVFVFVEKPSTGNIDWPYLPDFTFAGGPVVVSLNNNPSQTTHRLWLFRRRATASEPATYPFQFDMQSQISQVLAISVQGAANTTVYTEKSGYGIGTGNIAFPGLTTTVPNSWIGYVATNMQVWGSGTPPAGSNPTYTERLDSSSSKMYFAEGPKAIAGLTDSVVMPSNNSGSGDGWMGWQIALSPVNVPATGPMTVVPQPTQTNVLTVSPLHRGAATTVPLPLVIQSIIVTPNVAWGSNLATAAYRSHTRTTFDYWSTLTVAKPAGVQAGDELYMVVLCDGNSSAEIQTPPTPSGFTLAYGPVTTSQNNNTALRTQKIWMFRKHATASEPSSYSTSFSVGATKNQALMFAVRNAYDTGIQAANITTTPGTGNVVVNSLLTSNANSFIGFIASNWPGWGSGTAPTASGMTFTERSDVAGDGLYFAEGIKAAIGSTGNATMPSLNVNATDGRIAFMFVLAPDIATGPTTIVHQAALFPVLTVTPDLPGQATQLSNVLAYYKLDEGNVEYAVDQTNNYWLNMFSNGGNIGTGSGKIGTARLLNQDTTDYFGLDEGAFLFPSGTDFTAQVWIRPIRMSNYAATIGAGVIGYRNYTGNTNGNWWLNLTSAGSLIFGCLTSASSNQPTATRYTANGVITLSASFRHVVVRRVGTVMDIFVDGVKQTVSTGGFTGIQDNKGFTIGSANTFIVDECYDGYIDEAVVWPLALTDAEIAMMATGSYTYPLPAYATGPLSRVLDPSMIIPRTLTPVFVGAGTSIPSLGITLGVITVQPGIVSSPASVPALSLLSVLTVSPGLASAPSSVALPTMLLGQDIFPNVAASPATVANPSVSLGPIIVSPGIALAPASVADPSLALGALTVSPDIVLLPITTQFSTITAYYKLDEADSADAVDSVGTKTLTQVNAVGTNATGKLNSARVFTATSLTRLTRSDTSFRFPTGDFTVQAWVYPTGLFSFNATWGAGVACHITPDAVGDWYMSVNSSGGVRFGFYASALDNPAGQVNTAGSLINNNTWSHVVCRKKGSDFSIWVNGVRRPTTTQFTQSWPALDFSIGRLHDTTTAHHFTGRIDEVGVWPLALNDAEINYLSKTRPYPFATVIYAGLAQVPEPLVDQGGAPQTISPNIKASITSVKSPAMLLGAIDAFPDTILATTSVYDPALVTGLLLVSPDICAAATLIYDPNLAIGGGPQTIVPDQRAAATVVSDPLIALGAIIVLPDSRPETTVVGSPSVSLVLDVFPDSVASATTVSNPTLLATLTVSPNTRAATTLVYDPIITLGAVTILLDTVGPTTFVPEPVADVGGINLFPLTVSSITEVYPPSGTIPILLTPDIVLSTTVVNIPAVVLGVLTLVPDMRLETTTVSDPNISLGLISVFPDTRLADTTVSAPALTIPILIVPDFRDATSFALTPSVSLGDLIVLPDTRAAATTTGDPNIVLGGITVSPVTIDSTTFVLFPAVLLGVLTVVPDTRVTETIVANPGVSLGAIIVSPDISAAATLIHDPSLTFGPTSIVPDVWPISTAVPEMVIDAGGTNVFPQSLASTTVVSDPALTIPILLEPNTAVVSVSVLDPTVDIGVLTVTPDTVSSTTVFQPSAIQAAAPQTVTPDIRDSATQVPSLALLAELTVNPLPVARDVPSQYSNLVAYYKLDEFIAEDAIDSFAGKTATCVNSVSQTSNGRLNSARVFGASGLRHFTRVDTSFRFPTGDFTAQAWVKPASGSFDTTYGAGVVGHLTPDAVGDWFMSINSLGQAVFAFFSSTTSNPAGLVTTDAGNISSAVWTHLVCRKQGSDFSIWLNGVKQAVSLAALPLGWDATNFSIGRNRASGISNHYGGVMDEVAIWPIALTDPEIAFLANGKPYPLPATIPGFGVGVVYTPDLTVSLTLSPDVPPTLTQVPNPDVSADRPLSIVFVPAATQVFPPSLDYVLTVVPGTALATAQVPIPSLDIVLTVAPASAAALAAVFQPTLASEYLISPDAVAALTGVLEPSVDLPRLVGPDFLLAVTEAFQPNVLIGMNPCPDFVGPVAVCFDPSLDIPRTAIPDFLTSLTQVFGPNLAAELTVNPDLSAAATQVPSVVVSQGGAPTFIFPDTVVVTEVVYDVTLSQSLTVDVDLLTVPTQVPKPFIDPGIPPRFFTPNFVPALTGVPGIDIYLAAFLYPDTVLNPAVTYAPSIDKVLTVSPLTRPATTNVRDVVVTVPILVSPELTVSTAQTFSPLLIIGSYLLPGTVSAPATAYDPAVGIARTVEPVFVLALTQVYSPALHAVLVVNPDFFNENAEVYAPVLILQAGPRTFFPDTILSATTVPDIIVGYGLFVTPDLLTVGVLVPKPILVLQAGPRTMVPDLVAATTEIFIPFLNVQQFVLPDAFPIKTNVRTPIVMLEYLISLETIVPHTAVFPPVLTKLLEVDPDFLADGTQVFSVTLDLAYTVSPETAEAFAQLFEPEILLGDVAISPDFLVSRTIVPDISMVLARAKGLFNDQIFDEHFVGVF